MMMKPLIATFVAMLGGYAAGIAMADFPQSMLFLRLTLGCAVIGTTYVIVLRLLGLEEADRALLRGIRMPLPLLDRLKHAVVGRSGSENPPR